MGVSTPDLTDTPTSAPTLKAFTFNSEAIALRGNIRKPYYQELGKHAVVKTYAGSAGQGRSEFNNFSLANTISYKTAYSEVTAQVIGTAPKRLFRTRVESVVQGLNVLNGRIKADAIVGVLESVLDERLYPKERVPRISPFGSRIENLTIDGQLFVPQLPPVFGVGQPTVESFFDLSLQDTSRFKPVITATPFHKEGLGTLYFAEWVYESPFQQKRQALVMLRMALGSGDGLNADASYCSTDGSGIDP